MVVTKEQDARALALKAQEQKQQVMSAAETASLDRLSAQIRSGVIKDLNIILKTDVQGSIEPIRNSLQQLSSDKVRVRVVQANTGSITEGDILLAQASDGIVIGFNTRPTLGAQRLAELQSVEIRSHKIIYEMVEEIERAVQGMLEPTYVDVIEGRLEVREVFKASKKVRVAGAYVTEGKAVRNALARVLRNSKLLHESSVSSLRRFKDDVKEVSSGMECGVGIANYNELQIGDIIQFYRQERIS